MRVDIDTVYPRDDGDYAVDTNPGSKRPFASIRLDEDSRLELTIESPADADRLIIAATTAKRMLEAREAGQVHEHQEGAGLNGSHCTVCGGIPSEDIHTAPDEEACPRVTDDSRRCARWPGHPGSHRHGIRHWVNGGSGDGGSILRTPEDDAPAGMRHHSPDCQLSTSHTWEACGQACGTAVEIADAPQSLREQWMRDREADGSLCGVPDPGNPHDTCALLRGHKERNHTNAGPGSLTLHWWPAPEEPVTAADAIARLNPSPAEVYASHKGRKCECGKPIPPGAYADGYRTCRDHLSDIAGEPRFDRAAKAGSKAATA